MKIYLSRLEWKSDEDVQIHHDPWLRHITMHAGRPTQQPTLTTPIVVVSALHFSFHVVSIQVEDIFPAIFGTLSISSRQ